MRWRRGQSDLASSEIGKKLLQGWTMLGDECPCETCYGIPLVRPPKSVDKIDPRKVCYDHTQIYVALYFDIGMCRLWYNLHDQRRQYREANFDRL